MYITLQKRPRSVSVTHGHLYRGQKRLSEKLNNILFPDISLNLLYQKRFVLQDSFQLHDRQGGANTNKQVHFCHCQKKSVVVTVME